VTPDIINGLFETLGGGFVLLSVVKLYREKLAKGVSWLHVGFFTTWGFWNLFFYSGLDQWMSFWGGVGLVAANTFWLGQIVWYNYLWTRWQVWVWHWQIDDSVCEGFDDSICGTFHTYRSDPEMLSTGSLMYNSEYVRPRVADQFGGFDREAS
jgi:hypothetical protein